MVVCQQFMGRARAHQPQLGNRLEPALVGMGKKRAMLHGHISELELCYTTTGIMTKGAKEQPLFLQQTPH